MIYGYPDRPTVLAGRSLRLHYSGDRPKFAVDIYRQGARAAPDWVMRFPAQGWLDGAHAAMPGGHIDHGWPFVDIAIAADAAPGVYIANLTEADDANGLDAIAPPTDSADARTAKALFVVRGTGTGRRILFKISLFTYHAYNLTDGVTATSDATAGDSLYGSLWSVRTNLHRPGGGTGGDVFDAFNDPVLTNDAAPPSPRQTFAHCEAPFVRWLESNGYAELVDYCTDLDLEEDASILSPYALLVSVGHDEYWTANMRAALMAFRDAGGNLALFSGNVAFRPPTFDPASFSIARVGAPTDAKGSWRAVVPPAPENVLTGVSYAKAGGWWANGRPAVGYTVADPSHWVFAGTGLALGQTFGADDFLVGYECDGCVFADDGSGRLFATGEDSSPTSFEVLGVGPVPYWSREDPIGAPEDQAATMGLYDQGGVVFTAGTTDWARVLTGGSDANQATLGTITRNVLDRLGLALDIFDDLIAIDGFYSPDDDFRHAIIATTNGTLFELFYRRRGEGLALLEPPGALPARIIDVGAFYSGDDRYRHAICALSDGDVWEVFFNPDTGEGRAMLGTFEDIVAVSGFYSDDDQYRHAIVATANGEVTELFFNPQTGEGRVVIAQFSQIVDVASFYSPDDRYRHAIVATADGRVTEVFYHPDLGSGEALLGTFPGVRRVTAFYAADDALFRRRVVIATADGSIHELKFGTTGSVTTLLTANAGDLLDVGGFFSAGDGYRDVVFARRDGAVLELSYKG